MLELQPQLLDTKARTQFDKSYNINFRDGDYQSSRNFKEDDDRFERAKDEKGETQTMYKSPDMSNESENGETTLISDEVRVYKGGSWNDSIFILPLTIKLLGQLVELYSLSLNVSVPPFLM